MYHIDHLDKMGHITFTLHIYYQTFMSADSYGGGITDLKAAKWSTVTVKGETTECFWGDLGTFSVAFVVRQT